MKAQITADAFGNLQSKLVPFTTPASIRLGTRVCAVMPIDFHPYGTVPFGATGVVVFSDDESGEVEIKLDDRLPAMRSWDNGFSLMPFETESAIAALIVIAEHMRRRNTSLAPKGIPCF